MMKIGLFFSFLCVAATAFCQTIAGFWQTINEKTEKPQSIVAIYEYQGMYYGRLVATYDAQGKVKETVYAPKTRAPGVKGEPFYCGLDFIWNLKSADDGRYKGKIMDPEKGKTYNAKLWVKDGELVVRGELFVFGRNQRWLSVPESTFSSSFKKPDVSTFIPEIPKGK